MSFFPVILILCFLFSALFPARSLALFIYQCAHAHTFANYLALEYQNLSNTYMYYITTMIRLGFPLFRHISSNRWWYVLVLNFRFQNKQTHSQCSIWFDLLAVFSLLVERSSTMTFSSNFVPFQFHPCATIRILVKSNNYEIVYMVAIHLVQCRTFHPAVLFFWARRIRCAFM